MKLFLFLVGVSATLFSCHSYVMHPQIPTQIDTITVVYIGNSGYTLSRAQRVIGQTPKITDSSNKKWDWVNDTTYVVEVPVNPLDTLKDILGHPRYDSLTHRPILRQAFSIRISPP